MHPAVGGHVGGRDLLHPGLALAPALDLGRAGLAQVEVVAGGVALDPLAMRGRRSIELLLRELADAQRLHRDVAHEMAVAVAAAEVLRPLAAHVDHLVGERAEVVAGERVAFTESEAGEIGRLDVRDAEAGTPDRGAVGLRRIDRGRIRRARQRQGGDDDAERGDGFADGGRGGRDGTGVNVGFHRELLDDAARETTTKW